jgi:galactose-1-phosphate uridylyltransferase
MAVEFKKIRNTASILNPMNAFQEDRQSTEIRFDPLTGVKRLFNAGLTEKAKMFYQPADENLIETIANKTKETCIFCPQNLEKVTPKFPPDILPEGRFRKGDSWVFPNLFQIYEVTAIGIIGKDHFLKTDEFSPEILKNCFSTIIDFLQSVHSRRPEYKYAIFGMNYLPPAASSQVHPHIQIYMSREPFTYVDCMMRESKAYLERNAKNFWQDLIETEKRLGERYVGSTGNVEWMSSFSPMANNEFIGILPEKSNYFEYNDKDLDGITEGLSKILSFYKKDLQMGSFNYILYSGPLGEKSNSFRSSVRVATRPNFNGNYISDIHLAPLFYMEDWFANVPEYLAGRLRDYF